MWWLAVAWAVDAPEMGSEAPSVGVQIRPELAGRLFAVFPESGVSRGFSLPRSRLTVAVRGPMGTSARVATVGSRSGGEAGYIGIDGEALVPTLQIAEARVDLHKLGLSVAAGLVDDLWSGTHQPLWGLPEIAPEPALANALVDRSDLGGWVGWTSPGRWFSAAVSVTSGEGRTRRERNNGLNTEVLATVRPLQTEKVDLGIRLFGREGSYGVQQARDHRLGGSVHVEHPWIGAQAHVMAGWGKLGDGSLDPLAVGAFARTGADLPFVAYARGELHWAERGAAGTLTSTVRIGGGPRLPLSKNAPAWLGIGWEGTRVGPDASPIPGVTTGSDRIFLQLSADLDAWIDKDGVTLR